MVIAVLKSQLGSAVICEYQGHGYEMCRLESSVGSRRISSANYPNGEAIQSDLSPESWSSGGAKTVYGEGPFCFDVSPNFDACNSTVAYAELGHLYNGAVSDSRVFVLIVGKFLVMKIGR